MNYSTSDGIGYSTENMIKKEKDEITTAFLNLSIEFDSISPKVLLWTNYKAEHCKHIGLAGFEPAPSNLQTACSPNQITVLFGSLLSSAYMPNENALPLKCFRRFVCTVSVFIFVFSCDVFSTVVLLFSVKSFVSNFWTFLVTVLTIHNILSLTIVHFSRRLFMIWSCQNTSHVDKTTIARMLKSHAEAVLERLHDQYLRRLDCDVLLTAADHLGQNDSGAPNTGSSKNLNWTTLSCHKIVLRAVSSFFDRIFFNEYTCEKMKVDENVEGMLVNSENDDRLSLQITFHEISSHSLQALVNFAYTGNVAIETNILKRAIEDFKIMNVPAIVDKLETRLEEDLSFANCIPSLITSYALDRKEKYRKAMIFILEEFFRGFKSERCEKSWKNYLETDSPLSDISVKIKKILENEVNDKEIGISEDTRLLNTLINLIDTKCISLAEETKLVTFLVTKRREKCSIHLQNIQMHCCTDDEDLCVQCLINGHARHLIKPIDTAKYEKLAPYWEKMDLELEGVKESSRDRIIELDYLMEKIMKEKSRDLAILENCAEIKPKMDNLSNIFQSGKLESNDKDLLALEQFVAVLEKETSRSKDEYMEAKKISDDLLILMEKRCSSCASIVDANLDVETMEDLEEIDIDLPLSIHNCISILKRSKKDENLQLYEKAFNFVVENFTHVVNELGNNFHRRVNHTILENLLAADTLKVNSEDEVVSIMKEWLQFDFRRRKRYTNQLFKHVRFGCVSESVLNGIEADPYHVIMANEESKKLLEDAIAGNCCHRPRGFHKILAFGSNNSVLCYDSIENAWEDGPVHSNGDLFGAAMVGENVFIIGGRDQLNQPQSKVSVYNIKTKVWKNGPRLRNARYLHGTCDTWENAIYALGGYTRERHNGSSVEMLKCDETGEPIGNWQTIQPMRTARINFESASIDDKIYAIGGSPNKLATMEVYDPKVNSWQDCRSKLQGCHNSAVSTYNGEIYAFSIKGFCEKYNPATDTWTNIATLNYANRSVSIRCSAVLNDKIYLIGGHNYTETDIYDVETNAWTTIAALKYVNGYVYLRGSAVLNDKIYLVGGRNCVETDIYDVAKNTWSKGPPMPKQIGVTKCVSLKKNREIM